ncbi:MAG: glycoside hydrolase family 9 protein, partial [Oscillospiraceae bacterium]|nr:glycoside hydrolase family 9 protein [Oscillospiraceae bacterium]
GDGKLAQSILLEDKTGSFDWGNTRALGSLTLSLYADKLDADDTATVVKSITDAADTFVTYTSEQGYGLPYQGAKDKNGYAHYAWGSNSFIADNAIILAYAYDQSGQQVYLDGVTAAMDYILGRNPLDFSYVTGYGEHSGQYPHHRFWAKNLKTAMPKAPCGVLLGGANSNLQDPIMQDGDFVLGETPAQLCHVDNIEAYSVNECAVNWNSPLAWVTSYLCEQNGGLKAGAPSVGVQKEEPPKEDEILDEQYPVAITLPEGITAVGEQIFGKSKTYVTEVTVPDSVTLISKEAFSDCTKLASLNLPETIEEVGDDAFKGTPWVKAQLKDSPLLIINGLLIDGTASKGDVVVPDGVTSILGGAFKQNKSITSVTIPEGVTSIGSSAFHSCEALTSVSLPESLRTIGESAFAATGLTELTIPAGVREIGAEAFINTLDLPEVTVLANGARIGAEAFGCTSTFTANGQYSYIFVHRVREDFVVNCVKGSTAAAYAGATGVQVNYLASDAAVPGDVNGDGGVDIMDVILLNKYVLGVETLTDDQKKAADVDAGGEIDSTDSLNILKYVVELIDSFYAL